MKHPWKNPHFWKASNPCTSVNYRQRRFVAVAQICPQGKEPAKSLSCFQELWYLIVTLGGFFARCFQDIITKYTDVTRLAFYFNKLNSAARDTSSLQIEKLIAAQRSSPRVFLERLWKKTQSTQYPMGEKNKFSSLYSFRKP